MQQNNLIVAVTGNIATGKSFICDMILRTFPQFELVNADLIGHEVLRIKEVRDAVVQAFGNSILASDGSVDRKILGRLVFSDSDKLGELNAITHPALFRIAQERLSAAAATGRPVLFEAAVLFEAGWNSVFDTIILTVCHPALQEKRLTERGKMTREQARRIISSQMPQEQKISRATYCIDTTFGPQSFEKLLKLAVREILCGEGV